MHPAGYPKGSFTTKGPRSGIGQIGGANTGVQFHFSRFRRDRCCLYEITLNGAARRPFGDCGVWLGSEEAEPMTKLDSNGLMVPLDKQADPGFAGGLQELVRRKGFWIGVGAVALIVILAANDALGGAVAVIAGAGLYLLPSLIAGKKPNANTVFVVNIFFGWTVVGWVIALAMAVSNPKQTVVSVPSVHVQQRTGRTCPFCAEDIQPAAIVCKHCGRDLPPAR